MATWNGTIGVFEDKGSWVSGNDPDAIEMTDFTGGEGVDYIELKVLSYKPVESADMAIRKLPARNNLSIPLKKVQAVLQLKCFSHDDGSDYAEDGINKVMEFFRRHQMAGDPDTFIVIRRSAGGSWRYQEFEDNSENYDRKYLQGKISDIRINVAQYGYMEFTIQFAEANI